MLDKDELQCMIDTTYCPVCTCCPNLGSTKAVNSPFVINTPNLSDASTCTDAFA
jgi:hypothetical protein